MRVDFPRPVSPPGDEFDAIIITEKHRKKKQNTML